MARILVVDDDETVVVLLRDFLGGLGHEVACEMDGLNVGQRAEQWRPDLLISDIQMPHFYGTTAAVALQKSPATASIPVLFISAIAPDTAARMLDLIRTKVKCPDRLRFISKPVDFALLEKEVRELLTVSS